MEGVAGDEGSVFLDQSVGRTNNQQLRNSNRWDRTSFERLSFAPDVHNPELEVDDSCKVVVRGFGFSVSSASSGVGDFGLLVNVNQVVACVPTKESREDDKKAGYNLPFSLGRIVEVKGSGVVVTWLFSSFADGVWRPWDTGRKGASRLRRDELEWADLLRDHGGIVLVNFCADKTLKQGSLARLKVNVSLKMSEDQWRSYFRKSKK